MSHFYAYLSKLKYINRWGIMRNTNHENDMEHSMMVTMVTHSLCEIKNSIFRGNVDTFLAIKIAMYHETSEVMTGDLPTPIKYYNSDIITSFQAIEAVATKSIYDMLPSEIKSNYDFMININDSYERKIVKAADKICAYLKCIEELKLMNNEFSKAKEKIYNAITMLEMEEVDYWMKKFAPSFELTIDELN